MVVDTNVYIDFFRGKEFAKKTLLSLDHISMSVISYYELLQGIRNKKELADFHNFMKKWGINPIDFDERQSLRCRLLMEKYCLSHSLKMAESMIAACCIVLNEELLTGNYKDFKFISELTSIKYQIK